MTPRAVHPLVRHRPPPAEIGGNRERASIQRGERPHGFHDLQVLAVAQQVDIGDDDRDRRQPDPDENPRDGGQPRQG
jgi:hypothetical protein